MRFPAEGLLGRDAGADSARRPRWGDVAETAHQLSPAEWRTLLLLARLPLLWTGAVATLCGLRSASRVHAHVARLRAAGLVDTCRPSLWPLPWPGRGHPPRLLYLTDAGAAAVALAAPSGAATDDGASGPATMSGDAFSCGADRPVRVAPLPAMIPGVAHRAAAYALLAWLARERQGTAQLLGWEMPWRGRQTPGALGGTAGVRPAGGARTVTLPAGAFLGWRSSADEGATTAAYVLLPDLGTAPVAAFREALAGLTVLAHRWHAGGATAQGSGGEGVACAQPGQPRGGRELVIATVGRRRGDAWQRLLDDVADVRGLAPLPVRITTWQRVLGVQPPRVAGAGGDPLRPARVRPTAPSPARLGRNIPTAIVHGSTLAAAGVRLRTADRMLLDLVGRHPFLAVDDLAALLGWVPAAARRRRDTLVAAGLLRLFDPAEASCPDAGEVAAGLTELTPEGVAFVAAQQGLSVARAVRHNGLVGGGPAQRAGTRLSRARYVLVRHLTHTRGADRFFVALARAARLTGQRKAALVVWRNAVACARGRVRPDGYGVLRLDRHRYGFFLEYDRGTQDAAAYRQKLAAYCAYRDTGRYAADYAGFPAVLLVTVDTQAETRIAHYARTAAMNGEPLPLLLTTEWRYSGDATRSAHPPGPLGPSWRAPDDASRRRWPLPGTMRTTSE